MTRGRSTYASGQKYSILCLTRWLGRHGQKASQDVRQDLQYGSDVVRCRAWWIPKGCLAPKVHILGNTSNNGSQLHGHKCPVCGSAASALHKSYSLASIPFPIVGSGHKGKGHSLTHQTCTYSSWCSGAPVPAVYGAEDALRLASWGHSCSTQAPSGARMPTAGQ